MDPVLNDNFASHDEATRTIAEPSSSLKGSSIAEMDRMRREIRQLQEKRAAAMMNEVVELQRERDSALGRIKILRQTLEELTVENTALKESGGQGDQAQRIFHLEKTLLEEQLYSGDLKKKLQSANKQITTLKSKVKDLEQQCIELEGKSTLAAEEDSILERSLSMNDLSQSRGDGGKKENSRKGGSPSSNYRLPRLSVTRMQNLSSASLLSTPSGLSTPLQAYSPSPSPSVIPRRYKLAAVQSRAIGIQTEDFDESEANSKEKESHSLRLQIEALEEQIAQLNDSRNQDLHEFKAKKKLYKQLQAECEVLSNGLSEFSRWVRQKIQSVEEDLDICKVIYTLHGSLSQEAVVLSELQGKLGHSEQKVVSLTAQNRQLREAVKYAEEMYKQAKQQNGLLREKIVLLTPTKSSKQSFYHPAPLTSSPKLPHRSRQNSSPKVTTNFSSSPLLMNHYGNSKTTPTLNKASVVHESREQYKMWDDNDVV